jgi:hypothetical protein
VKFVKICEINHLKKTFKRKGYSNHEIRCVLAPKQDFKQKEEPAGIAVILYQQAVSNRTSRPVSKCNIKIIHIPVKRNIHIL